MSEELNKFISMFVQREKQDRYRSLLSSTKRRNDGPWDLLHDGRHLDMGKFIRLTDHRPASVTEQLRISGIKGRGYVLAVQGDLDGQLAELPVILQQYLGKATDVLAFFSAGAGGYYENHEGKVYVFSLIPAKA